MEAHTRTCTKNLTLGAFQTTQQERGSSSPSRPWVYQSLPLHPRGTAAAGGAWCSCTSAAELREVLVLLQPAAGRRVGSGQDAGHHRVTIPTSTVHCQPPFKALQLANSFIRRRIRKRLLPQLSWEPRLCGADPVRDSEPWGHLTQATRWHLHGASSAHRNTLAVASFLASVFPSPPRRLPATAKPSSSSL